MQGVDGLPWQQHPHKALLRVPPPQPSQHILFSIFTCHIITSSSYFLSSFFLLHLRFYFSDFLSFSFSCFLYLHSSNSPLLSFTKFPIFLCNSFLTSALLFPFSSHFCLIFPFSLLSFLNLLLFHILHFNIFSPSLLLSPCFSVLSSQLSFFCSSFCFFSAVFLCYLTFLPFLLLLSFLFSTFPFPNLISCPSSFSLLHIFLFLYLPFLPCILLSCFCDFF